MQSIRIALGFGFFLVIAGPGAAQTPSAQPAGQKPLNPTQEIAKEQAEGPAIEAGPAKIRVGGYIGVHGIYRSTNSGGGVGTSFGSIPYADTVRGNVSEARLSAQASRLSLRVDADFPQGPRFRRLSGYFEMDFAGATPGNIAVTTSGAGFRLRLAFAEVQYGQTFFLAVGQAFSLMTAPKDQLSVWPADVELTQAVDLNYVAGMVWNRSPQLRLTWRPSKRFNWAASVENPEQQLGSGVVTLPQCCAADIDAQYNTGADELRVPNLMPDFASRVTYSPRNALHIDAGGVLRVFRHTVAPYDEDFKATGGGASVNIRVNATPSTRILGEVAVGSGMGRYIGGLVPDAAFRSDGSISLIDTTSWVRRGGANADAAGVGRRLLQRRQGGGHLLHRSRRPLHRLRLSRLIEQQQPQHSRVHADRRVSGRQDTRSRFSAIQHTGVVADERAMVDAGERILVGAIVPVSRAGSLQPAVGCSQRRRLGI